MLRFQCSQLVVDRLDPLVFPGSVPSPHLHQIVGGNSFTPSMPHDSHDLVTESTCTSCTFSEDFSNYWTAVLYFRARNGTFKRVPQFPNEFLTGEGGITIYYIPDVSNKTEVTAFRPGFRMVVGDATATAPTSARKICYRCMPESGDLTHLNCDGPDVETFPTEPCPGGIRSVVTFPTCWDGVNLDSPNHMTHVAFSEGANDTDVGPTGRCPESHPIVIPQVMYEIMWNTTIFNDPELWPEDGSQPFVLSTGDEYVFLVSSLLEENTRLITFLLTEMGGRSTETTSLGGKMILSKGPWTRVASAISARCWRPRLPKMR